MKKEVETWPTSSSTNYSTERNETHAAVLINISEINVLKKCKLSSSLLTLDVKLM